MRKLVANDEVRKRIHSEGGDPLTSSPDEYAADIDQEETKWSTLDPQAQSEGRMIARALIAAACLAPHAALAAPAPRNAAEFARLPALGKLVEGGVEKDYRFRTYLVGKKPTSTGAITIFVGEIHMRVQDISGGTPRRPVRSQMEIRGALFGRRQYDRRAHRRASRRARKPRHTSRSCPALEPDTADRTWYNVWYAVCLDEFNKYPRNQEDEPRGPSPNLSKVLVSLDRKFPPRLGNKTGGSPGWA